MVSGDVAKLILGMLRMARNRDGLGNKVLREFPAWLDGNGGDGGMGGPPIGLVGRLFQGVVDGKASAGSNIVVEIEAVQAHRIRLR
jgi:hypothetical protein